MTKSLPDDQTIIRHVKRTFLNNDGLPTDPDAFLSGPDENNCPSYNWLECFDGTTEDRLDCIRARKRREHGKTSRFASLNVGQTREAVQEHITDSDIIHDPLDATDKHCEDPSHCLMTHIPTMDDAQAKLIGTLLIEQAEENETYPAIKETE